jgi:hypothetical protein
MDCALCESRLPLRKPYTASVALARQSRRGVEAPEGWSPALKWGIIGGGSGLLLLLVVGLVTWHCKRHHRLQREREFGPKRDPLERLVAATLLSPEPESPPASTSRRPSRSPTPSAPAPFTDVPRPYTTPPLPSYGPSSSYTGLPYYSPHSLAPPPPPIAPAQAALLRPSLAPRELGPSRPSYSERGSLIAPDRELSFESDEASAAKAPRYNVMLRAWSEVGSRA